MSEAPLTAIASPPKLTHLDQAGKAHMVNISHKAETTRTATAVATLLFSDPKTFDALSSYQIVKGDAIAVARVAAFQAAKKTADLVPLAHPSLHITAMSVDIDPFPGVQKSFRYTTIDSGNSTGVLHANRGGVTVKARIECQGKTGVEMEAITAATIGAVTMFDMVKAIDKGLVIMGARVIEKTGGKSGDWTWDECTNSLVRPDKNDGPKDAVPELHKLSNATSDIDEWNRGLSEEFSIPEEVQTEPRVPAPSRETGASDLAASGKQKRSRVRYFLSEQPTRSRKEFTRSDTQGSNFAAQLARWIKYSVSAKQRRISGKVQGLKESKHSSLAKPATPMASTLLSKPTTNSDGAGEITKDPIYRTKSPVGDSAHHDLSAKLVQNELRDSVDLAKPFVEVVGRNFEAIINEEEQIQKAARDIQRGHVDKVNKGWNAETMLPLDSNSWPGHANHHMHKVDSKSLQIKRFQREWGNSVYGRGSQVE